MRIQAPLVRVYLELGLQKKAAAAAAEVLRLAPDVSDRSSLAQMYVNVAGIHVQRSELDEADSALRRAEDLFREMELQHEIGTAHLARGLTLGRMGELEQARVQLESARRIFTDTGDDVELANTNCEIARVARLEGNLEEARRLLVSAVDLLRRTEDPHILAWAYRELGVCYEDEDAGPGREALQDGDRTLRAHRGGRGAGDHLSSARGPPPRVRGDDRAGCEAFRTGIVLVERLNG